MQFVFFDAVIEGKLTPYDENGLEIIDSAIHNPFGPNPPGCRYETITYDNVYDFFYKKEDIEKFLKPLEEQKANPLPADQAATLPPVKTIEPKYATPDQEKKYDAREIAKKYIDGCKKGSVPSIKEAVAKVKAKLAGSHYTEDTIRNWIKDLFPPESRKPGLRPQKT